MSLAFNNAICFTFDLLFCGHLAQAIHQANRFLRLCRLCIVSSYRIDIFESNLNFYGQQLEVKVTSKSQFGGGSVFVCSVLVKVDLKRNDYVQMPPKRQKDIDQNMSFIFSNIFCGHLSP